jgi:glycosyltransferase involved in cell wall biosynthesis
MGIDRTSQTRLCVLSQGQSVHTIRRLEYFINRGYEVHLISEHFCDLPGLIYYNPRKRLLNIPFSDLIVRFVNMVRYIKRIQPDLVHVSYLSPHDTLVAFMNFHPLVLTAWGGDVLLKDTSLSVALAYRLTTRFAVRKADLITSVSNQLQTTLEEMNGERTPNIVLRFGVDTDKFQILREGKRELRKGFGFPEDMNIVLSFRWIAPLYNTDTIIKAIPTVLKSKPDTFFVFKGLRKQADQKERNYFNFLNHLIKEFNIARQIRFLDDLTEREVVGLYNASDLSLSVPSSDGTPLSVLEAMACGTPVIVSDLPSLQDLIEHRINGCIVPVRDSTVLAEEILFLLDRPELCGEMRAINRKFVEEHCDFKTEMAATEDMFLRLIKEHTKGRD